MEDILNILTDPILDDRINKIDYHAYQPFLSSSLNYMDEIRIVMQQLDAYTLTCDSFVYLEGSVSYNGDAANISLSNNFVSFLFDEIRFELNGIDIDQNKNVGITTTLKNTVSLSSEEEKFLSTSSWNSESNIVIEKNGKFDCILPLNKLLGFCEDYKKIIVNAKQELILIGSRNDLNCVITTTDVEAKISLTKVQWWVPHVIINVLYKLHLLKIVNNNTPIRCSYRTWELYEYPLLPESTKHTWAVKTSTQLEKARYVILAFQTDRKNSFNVNSSYFDKNNITNVRLYLNSDVYPYENINVNFDSKKYLSLLYYMFSRFRQIYYGKNSNGGKSIYNLENFYLKAPMFVIDCSRSNDSIKLGTIDVRIEFESLTNIPANTSAYCLIIHDKMIEYSPLTNMVQKII